MKKTKDENIKWYIDRLHSNYISPKYYEKYYKNGWYSIDFDNSSNISDQESLIKQLINDGYSIKTGYMATSIKGLHTFHIFKKRK